jgi:AraC-like DNA-binding protein
VTDIALDCGFTTSQYFATVFRRQMGRSPRSYRTEVLAARGRATARSAVPKSG